MNMFTSELGIRIGTLVSGANDPVSYIKQILPYGFESFELTWWRTLGNADLPRLANELKEILDGTGVVISSIGIYGNPLENDAEDVETREGWEKLIENAHLFGTDVVCGFTGRVRNQPIEVSLPRFASVFSPLANMAEDFGVRLAFENCAMDGTWQTGDWNIAHHPEHWERMFNALKNENLGLEWEPCHQMIALLDPIPQIRHWASRIFHVHGKCATIRKDVLATHGIHGTIPFAFHRTPGFGDCNWRDVISELRMGGFSGSIDIEGWHDPIYKDTLEMTGQVRSLHYLKECRGGDFVPNPT